MASPRVTNHVIMPSVAIQTKWSWLEDIAKITDYYQQIKVEDVALHLSISQESVEQLNEVKKLDTSSESSVTNDCVKELHDDGCVSGYQLATIGAITDDQQHVTEATQPDHHISQQPYDNKLLNKASDLGVAGDYNNIAAGSTGTVEPAVLPKPIAVQPSTVDATMPLILKYSRESEEKPADIQSCAVSCDNHVISDESLLMTCEFCGAEINPDFNPLCKDNNNLSDSDEDDCGGYCCHDYKLFIELTTNYMQQMVQTLQSEQAKRIDVKPGKKLMRKAAQEQAEARIKSRRLHDRLMRSDSGKLIDPIKILQSASFYTLSKQMKTINFSLSSQKYSTQGWAVRVSSGKHPHQVMQQVNHRRRRRRDRASVQATDNFLQPTICLRNDITNAKLPSKNVPVIKTYGNGNVFQVLLPDGTGHCLYPSGNLAIVSTVLYPGLLSYILYEDDPVGAFLGYFDEAGRAYVYYRDYTIKLFFSYSIGKLIEPGGKVRKKWKWKEFHGSKSPRNACTIVQISQQFHLKISNQEDIVLTFNSLSHHSKFSVGCKITEPIAPPLVQSEVLYMQQYYKKTRAEISFLLQSMADCQRHLTTHSNKSTIVLPPLVRTKVKSSTAKHVTF